MFDAQVVRHGSRALASAQSCIFRRAAQVLLHASLFAASLAAIAVLCSAAAAQTAHFSAAYTVVATSALTSPGAVAVDSSGNLYIADTGNNRIEVETLQNSIYTQWTLPTTTTLNGPQGVAVDFNGNVYIADTQNNRVIEETRTISSAGLSYVESTVANYAINALELPTSVAVDKNLAVYIASYGNDAAVRMTPSGTQVNGQFVVSYNQFVISVNQLVSTYGIAVDANLNVYLTDYSAGNAYEIPWTGTAYGTGVSFQKGMSHPTSLAVDGSRTVYITDSGNNRIIEDVNHGGTTFYGYNLLPGLDNPMGVAADALGNIYIADTSNNRILDATKSFTSFGAINVGASSSTETLVFVFDAGGSRVYPEVMTQGVESLDFTDAGTGSCNTNGASYSYNAGEGCTIDVSFIPEAAGVRNGAALLMPAVGEALLQGTGVAPQITFQTSSLQPQSLGRGFGAPSGLAVDGSGNVYVADIGNKALYEVNAAGGYTTVGRIEPDFVFVDLQGVALDAAGDLFTVDTGSDIVNEFDASTGSNTTLSRSFNNPTGVAVDGSGNVFVADEANNAVKEIVAVNGRIPASPTINTLGGSFSFGYPQAVAVDGSGNVYVSDTGNHAVYQILAAGGYTTVNTLGSGFQDPSGLAVDASGNVYVADITNVEVKEILAAGGYTTVNPLVGLFGYTPGSGQYGLALDSSGNVYFTDINEVLVNQSVGITGTVNQLNLAAAPSLSFPNTVIGTASSAQTVTVSNIGNAPLNFLGWNATGAAYPPSWGCPIALAAGANCTLTIEFSPTALGAQSGTVTLTDNTLNAASVTQSITVSGTGIAQLPQSITFPTITAAQYALTSLPLSATATSGLAVTFTSTTPAICTVAGSKASLLTVGTCILHAAQAGNSTYAAAAAVSQGFYVHPATQTINFKTISGAWYALQQIILSATASSGLAVSFASTTPTVCSVAGNMVSLLIGGSCILQASQAGNTLYGAALPVTQVVAVHLAHQSITVTPVTATQYALSQLTLSASSSSGLPVTLTSVTPTVCTLSGNTASFLIAGTCDVHANQAGNATYAVAPLIAYDIDVHPIIQTINFSTVAVPVYPLTKVTLSATATSGLTVSFASITPTICTVSGKTASLLTAGNCYLHALQTGNPDYAAAPIVTQEVVVTHLTQAITFPAIAGQIVGANVTLSATASSGLTVSFASATGTVCSVSGTTATMLTTGACVIHATQAGNSIYSAAPTVSQSITVKAN